MATYHIGSFQTATVDAMPSSGKIAPVNGNANGNKCVAYEDANFSNLSGKEASTQQVFPLPAGIYWTVMPFNDQGPCMYCSFYTLSDLLNNAQFTPDLAGGAIGGGVFGTSDDVASFIAQVGGLLILPAGIPYTI